MLFGRHLGLKIIQIKLFFCFKPFGRLNKFFRCYGDKKRENKREREIV
jgi:hypothetical protein